MNNSRVNELLNEMTAFSKDNYFKGEEAALKTYQQFYSDLAKAVQNLALTIKASSSLVTWT